MTGTPAHTLTPGQLAVIAGYARGLTAAQVADELGIAEKRVLIRTHKASRALGINGARQAALVDYAYGQGHLTIDQPRQLAPLTPRLAEVLACVARGLGHRAMAAELGITARTARTHRARLLRVLGVHTTARAVAVAWEAGLLGKPEAAAPVTQGGPNQ